MRAGYIVQSCWLLASFQRKMADPQGFPRAQLPSSPRKQQKPGAFEKLGDASRETCERFLCQENDI